VAGSKAKIAVLRAAIDRGVQRLEALAPDGRWSTFRTLAGTSDVWVTAFVAAHLQTIRPRSSRLRPARSFLLGQQQHDGGWGFGHGVPSDADSTAWCLSILRTLRPAPRSALIRAEAFLRTHQRGLGFQTYRADSGIREYMRAPKELSIEGWTSTHPDVTAAVLAAGPIRTWDARLDSMQSALIASQTAAGLIDTYWWRSPFYALALTLRALRVHRRRPPRVFIARAREVLDGKQLPEGGYGLGANLEIDAFSTALALEAYSHLAQDTRRTAVLRVADALLAAQRPDGGWEGAFVLRIPAPSVVNPKSVHKWSAGTGGGNAFVKDKDGIFATVVACGALDLHRRVLEGTYSGLERTWAAVKPIPNRQEENVAVLAPRLPPVSERCNAPTSTLSR